MMGLVREFRLIPVVLLATVCLFALKVLGLVLDGGYTLNDVDQTKSDRLVIESAGGQSTPSRFAAADVAPARSRQSWAQEMFNFPELNGTAKADSPARSSEPVADTSIVTGSVAEKKPEAPADKPAAPAKPPAAPDGTLVPLDGNRASPGERAILERLGERRQELDARARELEIRENLLRSAEKRIETRAGELKETEGRINGAMHKKDEVQAAQFKGLVIMYENMKAKDAAKIFDRLDMKVLIEVATQINPRRMSDIMAQMAPEAAERLTVEMANRASMAEKTLSGADLPKIEGRPPAP